jgi:hypothetical protein
MARRIARSAVRSAAAHWSSTSRWTTEVWHFQGGFGYIGTPRAAYGIGLEADFPGLSHIDGDCAFEVLDGGMGRAVSR